MRRNIGFFLCLCTVVALLTACNQPTPTPQTVVEQIEVTRVVEGEEVVETQVITAEPEPVEEIELEFAAYSGGSGNTFYHIMADLYEAKHPNVTLVRNLELGHGEYGDVMSTRIAAGDLPDVFIMDDGGIPSLIEAGHLLALDDFIAEYDIDVENWYPQGFMETVKDDEGHIYGLPYYISANLMVYRTDVFDELGLDAPDTWEDLLTTCQTLQDAGYEHPFGWRVGNGFYIQDFIFSNGGHWMNEDRTAFTYTAEENVETIQFLRDLQWQYGCVDPELALTGGAERWDRWENGEIVMMAAGGFEAFTLDQNYPATKGKWAMTNIPCNTQCQGVSGGSPLVISANTEHPEEAFELVASMVTPKGALRAAQTGFSPGNMATMELEEFQTQFPHMVGYKDALEGARLMPLHPQFGAIHFGIFHPQNQVLFQDETADVEAVLGDIQDQAMAELEAAE